MLPDPWSVDAVSGIDLHISDVYRQSYPKLSLLDPALNPQPLKNDYPTAHTHSEAGSLICTSCHNKTSPTWVGGFMNHRTFLLTVLETAN